MPPVHHRYLDEHLQLQAQARDLQGHRGDLVSIGLQDVVGEHQAVDLLDGVTIEIEDAPPTLWRRPTRRGGISAFKSGLTYMFEELRKHDDNI